MKPVVIALVALTTASAPARAQDRLVITSATVIDGRTGRANTGISILIEGTRIVTVGPSGAVPIPQDATVIDGTGKWVVPGYIDVHTHSTTPSVLQRALALGVTTMHMMPSRPTPAESLRALEIRSNESGSRSPRLRITSPLFTGTFPGNVLLRATNFVTLRNVAEVDRILPTLRRQGFRGIKVIQDDGRLWSGDQSIVPRLDDNVFRALVDHAHQLGLTVFAHASQRRDTEQALALRADVFVHGTMDSVLPEPVFERMRKQGTVWAPAFRIVAQGADRAAYARRLLDDPILAHSLTPEERAALLADSSGKSGGSEPFVALPRSGRGYLDVIAENTRRAQTHGVTIAVGSDAGVNGNGPGIGTHMEMELLQNAGLTPAEVIVAATFGAAVALGVQEERGTVEPGKLADLVILTANPLTDIRNARAADWVIKGGKPMRAEALR